jgi:hypothetical protein
VANLCSSFAFAHAAAVLAALLAIADVDVDSDGFGMSGAYAGGSCHGGKLISSDGGGNT